MSYQIPFWGGGGAKTHLIPVQQEHAHVVVHECTLTIYQVVLYQSLKILRTSRFENGKDPASTFATIKDEKLFDIVDISICFWVSILYPHHAEVLSRSDHSGLLITFKEDGNYFAVGSYFIWFEFGMDNPFIPGKWMFFCFTYDNTKKIIKIFHGSDLLLKKQLEENYLIFPNNFLQKLILGRSAGFAGYLTRLNMWSQILDSQDIKKLYECKEISIIPDILKWDEIELNLGPSITIMDMPDDDCLSKNNTAFRYNVYQVMADMQHHKRALRLCQSLGGYTQPPGTQKDVEEIKNNLKNIPKNCNSLWIPIFRQRACLHICDFVGLCVRV